MRYSITQTRRRSKRRCHCHYKKKRTRNSRTSRSRTIKGGLGPNDGPRINVMGTYSFQDQSHVEPFASFIFGTPLQYAAWRQFLDTCLQKNVPVYILTAGNKIGIIRTLQLLNLADHFQEVLCTLDQRHVRPPPPNPANPHNSSGVHNFAGFTKYQVIREIMAEPKHGIPCEFPVKGCLFDDSDRNRDTTGLCPSIEFVFTKAPGERPADYKEQEHELLENPFFKLCNIPIDQNGLETVKRMDTINFTPISKIERAGQLVDNGTYKIIFIDFDETFQIWPSALVFHTPRAVPAFNYYGYNIVIA